MQEVIISNTAKYIASRQKMETPAILVWNHSSNLFEANEKYNHYLVSNIDQHHLLNSGEGTDYVHSEDIEKFREFILSNVNTEAVFRLLTVEGQEKVHARKEILCNADNFVAFTIITIKRAEEYLELEGIPKISVADRLTGLISKDSFEEYCKSQKASDRERQINMLGLICVDQHSELRKTCSTEVMDHVIVRVADAIKAELWEGMILARYWEDCFLLCYHDAPSVESAHDFFNYLAGKIRITLGDARTITVSIGAARCRHTGYCRAFEYARKGLFDAHSNGGAQATVVSVEQEQDKYMMTQLPPKRDIFIRTFGYFEVFINGEAISFKHNKSKELLALLTAHRGGFVSAEEIIATLWENEPVNKKTLSRSRKVFLRLKEILKENGMEDIIVSEKRRKRLDVSKVKCDFMDCFDNNTGSDNYFNGTFMAQYSWAEEFSPCLLDEYFI